MMIADIAFTRRCLSHRLSMAGRSKRRDPVVREAPEEQGGDAFPSTRHCQSGAQFAVRGPGADRHRKPLVLRNCPVRPAVV
jgi:hypothetical protein